MKYAWNCWNKANIAMLPVPEILAQGQKVNQELGYMHNEFKVPQQAQAQANASNPGSVQPVQGSLLPPLTEPQLQAETQVKQSPSETAPVIHPRLRIEDLKPPPAKRAKTSHKVKDEASPAATSELTVEDKGKPDQGGVVGKRPVPKKRRKTNPIAGSPSDGAEPGQSGADKVLDVAGVVQPVTVPATSNGKPLINGLTQPDGLNENVLGIKFSRDMMRSRRAAEEEQIKLDPVGYLTSSWDKLKGLIEQQNGREALDRVKEDLDLGHMEGWIPFDDGLNDMLKTYQEPMKPVEDSRLAIPLLEERPLSAAGNTEFDYSCYIDISALETDDVPEETGDPIALGGEIVFTPDLLAPSDPRFEVSPASEGVTDTPQQALGSAQRASLNDKAGIEREEARGSLSPIYGRIDVFGEDGWLTEGLGEDGVWEEGF
jgi:hypothetical protein